QTVARLSQDCRNGGTLETRMAQLAGIEVRHRTTCATRSGGKCNCKPAYQASVWSAREGKRLRKTFPTLSAARAWRAEAQTAIRHGKLRAPVDTTLREAAAELVDGMRSRQGADEVGRRLQAERRAGLRAGAPRPRPAALGAKR